MKNKKGFTLIELIAVLVILAIIALIVIPIVIRIINDAKRSADERSIDAFGRTIEYTMALYALNNKGIFPEKCTTEECYTEIFDASGKVIGRTTEKVEYTGSKVTSCTIQIPDGSCIQISNCKVNGRKVNYKFNACIK